MSARTATGTAHATVHAQLGARDDAGTPALRHVLVALLGAPVAWALHLAGSYVLIAWACSSGWTRGVRWALLALTAAALAAALGSALLARRRWMVARAVDRPDDDAWDARMGERTARISFLMVVGLVTSLVFAVGIVYAALTMAFVPACQPGVGA